MNQIEFEGSRVISWIDKADPGDFRLLNDAEYSDSYCVWTILEVGRISISIRDEYHCAHEKPLKSFQLGTFFLSQENGKLLEINIGQISSPDEKARDIVTSHGFSLMEFPNKESVKILAQALSQWHLEHKIPDSDEWTALYNLFNDETISIHQKKKAIEYFSKWLDEREKSIGGKYDIYYRGCIAALYRHSKQRGLALTITDFIELPNSDAIGSNSSKAVLCTVRAATIMDYLDGHSSKPLELLLQARKLLNKANAIGGSDRSHIMMAYMRLKQLDKKLS